MTVMKAPIVGFGATEGKDSFVIDVPRDKSLPVSISEIFYDRDIDDEIITKCRSKISREIWDVIEGFIAVDLNKSLKKVGYKPARFKTGRNYVERILGMPVCVLFWSVEGATPSQVVTAIKSWSRYGQCENFFLYQNISRDKGCGMWNSPVVGWRLAIRHAFIPDTKDDNE